MGATLVGLNWRLSLREIAEILADADAALPLEAPGAPAPRFGTQLDAEVAAAEPRDPGHEGMPEEVALILHTSGTTGRPKGAMLTDEGMSHTARLAEAWGMGPDAVNLVAKPLFHIGGCGYGSATMMAGGRTVLMAEVDVAAILRGIPEYRLTHTFLVPAVVQMPHLAPEAAGADLSTLELLMHGASPMGDVLLRHAMDAFGCRFMQAYEMTEAAGTVVILRPEDHDPDGPRAGLLKSCGRTLPLWSYGSWTPRRATMRRRAGSGRSGSARGC